MEIEVQGQDLSLYTGERMEQMVDKIKQEGSSQWAVIKAKQSQSLTTRQTLDEEVYKKGLIVTLMQAASLLGIKGEISQTDKDAILQYFKIYEPSMSLEEVYNAFFLEACGRLEPRTKSYNLFNLPFVSEIIGKYKTSLFELSRYMESRKIEEVKPVAPPDPLDLTLHDYRLYRQRASSIAPFLPDIYKYLYHKKLLPPHTRQYKSAIEKKAASIYIAIRQDQDTQDAFLWRYMPKDIKRRKGTICQICQRLVVVEFYDRVDGEERLKNILSNAKNTKQI